ADDNSSPAEDPARIDPTPEALTLPAEPVAPATNPATDPASEAEANDAPAAAVAPPPPPERLAPQTSLTGSARDQVNADGELLKPSPRGPLAGLRDKLGG
ncbi:MAG: hypothetical protein RLZZ106_1339, partial [Cyanobacteriota bacterium]